MCQCEHHLQPTDQLFYRHALSEAVNRLITHPQDDGGKPFGVKDIGVAASARRLTTGAQPDLARRSLGPPDRLRLSSRRETLIGQAHIPRRPAAGWRPPPPRWPASCLRPASSPFPGSRLRASAADLGSLRHDVGGSAPSDVTYVGRRLKIDPAQVSFGSRPGPPS